MQYQLYPLSERGRKDIGWLKSNFVFSFSDFYNPVKSAFGTLIAFNDDAVEVGRGFGLHPHQNMEIISVMLKGTMNHKDDMGYVNTVKEGGVQIMSAGSGLRHEEWNVGDEEVNFLQIWIEPKLHNIRPRYQAREFPRLQRVNQLTIIVNCEEGLGHCWINQNAKISLGYFDKETEMDYHFNKANKAVFLFMMEGQISINEQITLGKREAVGIWDTTSIRLKITPGCEFIIIETVINQK